MGLAEAHLDACRWLALSLSDVQEVCPLGCCLKPAGGWGWTGRDAGHSRACRGPSLGEHLGDLLACCTREGDRRKGEGRLCGSKPHAPECAFAGLCWALVQRWA